MMRKEEFWALVHKTLLRHANTPPLWENSSTEHKIFFEKAKKSLVAFEKKRISEAANQKDKAKKKAFRTEEYDHEMDLRQS